MKPPIRAIDLHPAERPAPPEPYAGRLGKREGRELADYFELSQFGAHLETLQPGEESALRHWHSHSDEMVYLLEGELVLRSDDGDFPMTPGMVAGFKGGDPVAHHLLNRSDRQARFLVVGTRDQGDQVTYPDDDFQWLCDAQGQWYAARRDGTPL
ncbi:MAG: cupin domain-containing protein [Xanthomonadales bacterium]|nr:cupin domain-containing protein [Xanthomonadales bacterium]